MRNNGYILQDTLNRFPSPPSSILSLSTGNNEWHLTIAIIKWNNVQNPQFHNLTVASISTITAAGADNYNSAVKTISSNQKD